MGKVGNQQLKHPLITTVLYIDDTINISFWLFSHGMLFVLHRMWQKYIVALMQYTSIV